jgi:tetratricopeptide (TPR) repeat protein
MSRDNEAQEAHGVARDVLAPFVSEGVSSPQCRLELARTYNHLGGVRYRMGRPQGGRTYHLRAWQLLEELVKQDPDNPEYMLAQARCFVSMYRTFALEPFDASTISWKATAIANLEKLVERYPSVPDYKCELAETLTTLGISRTRGAEAAQQEATLRRAVEVARELNHTYAGIPRYRACLARSLQWLGNNLQNSKQTDESMAIQLQAVRLYRALAEEFPTVAAYQRYAGWSLFTHAEMLRRRDQFQESRASLEEAIMRQKNYMKLRPTDWFAERTLARHYQSLSETLKKLGEHGLALEADDTAKRLTSSRRGPFGRQSNSAQPAQNTNK